MEKPYVILSHDLHVLILKYIFLRGSHPSILTLSFVLHHVEYDGSTIVWAEDSLGLVTEWTNTLGHEHPVEVSPLVHPTPILGEGIQLVIGDEVRFEILLPVANALQLVVRVSCW